MQTETYCVYKHTTPNGKLYVGMTGEEPKKRWKNGLGYQTHTQFFREIIAWGWNNITHEILHEGLSFSEASDIEIDLIMAEVKKDRKRVLNHTYNPLPVIEKCYDNRITDATVRRYAFRFLENLDDWWLENYKHLTGSFPFKTTLFVGCVELIWFEMPNATTLIERRYKICYPESVETVKDLHAFLCEGHEGEWIKCEPS